MESGLMRNLRGMSKLQLREGETLTLDQNISMGIYYNHSMISLGRYKKAISNAIFWDNYFTFLFAYHICMLQLTESLFEV